MPSRSFSADGSTFYMSVVQVGEVRLMAVDLGTGQVTFSPREGGVRLLDVKDDVVLVTVAGHRSLAPHQGCDRYKYFGSPNQIRNQIRLVL